MRKLKLFFTMLMLIAFSVGNVWAVDSSVTEDFELQEAGSTYNSQLTYDESASNASIAWYVEHGTVSTNSTLSGTKSMQMRGYYAKNSAANVWNGDLPYLESKTAVAGLKSISLKIAAAATFRIDFLYSTDGTSWNAMITNEETPANATDLSFTTSASTVTYNIPSSDPDEDYFIRIVANTNSTHTANPSKTGNIVIRVDDILFTYDAGGSQEPTVSADPTSVDFGTKNIYGGANTTGYIDVAVSGSNLTANITAALGGDDAGKFSISGAPFAQTTGSASGTLRVSYNNVTEARKYSANVTLSSGAIDVVVPISLEVINEAPVEYVKVTSAPTDWSGEYLLVYENSSTEAYVWTGVDAAYSYASATISDNKITKPSTAAKLTIASMDGGYSILVNGGTNDGKYVGRTAGSNGMDFNASAIVNVISYSGGLTIGSNTSTVAKLQYYSNDKKFRYYTSSQKAVQLYKKVVSSEVTISAPEHTTLTVKNSSNVAVASGASIAEGARLYVGATSNDATAYRVAAKAYKTGDESTVVTIDATDSITMPGYPITITADETTLFAVNIAVNDANMGSATMDGGTATVYKANNETVTLVATPESGHEFVNWTATTGITFDDATKANGAIATITAAGTITANFQAQSCASLAAPILDEVTKTYNSATIAWNTVANADSYSVNVVNHSTSASVFNGSVDALSKELTGLAANTQYDYTVMAMGDGTSYCDENNPLLEGNFTTNDYPAATLTLSDANGTSAFAGSHKLNDVIQLPATAASCSKTFVGWSANSECAVAPEYAPGADYTLSATSQTVYAVYADVTGGGTSTTNIAYNTETTTNMAEDTNEAAKFNLDADEWSVVGAKGGSSNNVGLNKAKDIRLYWADGGGNTLTITAPQTITSVGLTFTGDSYSNAWVKVGGETVTLSDGVYPINATTFVIGNNNSESAQVRISNIAVNFTTAGTPSNWSTTCAAAPEAIVDPEEVNAPAAGVANGVIEAAYDNVNESAVSVALYNDAACTEAFEGSWLTASINGDKNIAYTIAENTSYNDARTAYIKLTAPETTAATDPAVVVIPVSQAKKAAVFSSLQELVAADLADPSTVTVSFSDVTIKDFYIYNSKRSGIVFDIQKAGQDIKIYFNNQTTIADWETGGKVSGTLTNCTWNTYSSAWQLAPTGWAWNNLTYTEPAEVSTVVVSGAPTKTTYVDGQKLDPAGLTVTVTYTDESVEVNPVGVTFSEVALAEGDESAYITATFGSETSAAYNVTGLTVTAIPDKTIAEFIAAGGTRCYLEGIVSNIANTTYGNFDLEDASGTIYVYGCLTSEGVSKQFSTLGISAGDKIKVIAEEYTLHATNGDEAINVQFVSKISPVAITIADKTLEVGDEWTIEATTDPAAAVANISYSIKEGSDDCITLDGNKITAIAEGEATIIASIPAGEGYLANSVEFTVTVYPAAVHTNVVILAEYDGHYYALNNTPTATEVAFCGGKVVVADEATKNAILWDRAEREGVATFYNEAANKYLNGSSSTTLSVVASEGNYTSWTWKETATKAYYTSAPDASTVRTFLYQSGQGIKNYAASNIGNSSYAQPTMYTGEIVVGEITTLRGELANGQWGTYCPAHNVVAYEGATFYTIAYVEKQGEVPYKVFYDEIGEGESLQAGHPYIFIADEDATAIKGVKVGDPATEGINDNGFIGKLSQYDFYVSAEASNAYKYYIVYGNEIRRCGEGWFRVGAERAYLDMTAGINTVANAPAAGRRRVCLTNQEVQIATGVDQVQSDQVQSTKVLINGELFILRGEKMYDATGKLVK